jgi:hypothetical protein
LKGQQKYGTMMKNFLTYGIPVSFLVLLFIPSVAQPYPCGTSVTQEQKEYESALSDSVAQLTELNRTLHLAVYIVKDNKGQPNVDPAALSEAIAQVNTAFDRIKTTFTLYSLSYIDNYNFNEIRMGTNEKAMLTQHAMPEMVCIYLVNKLYNTMGQEIGSYTYYPFASTEVILLKKDCLNGAFLTEQMGHFFNLYHTHETAFGNEYVKRTNCSTAGDRCCDTPADPGLTGIVSAGCQYNGTGKDAGGTYYAVTTHNFMSFSPLNCRCYFSEEQYIRMINCMLKAKKHLW